MSAQDNEPLGVEVVILEVASSPGHWLVEAIDVGSEGEVYRATFDGHKALECAQRWAETMWPGRAELRMPRPKPTLSVVLPPTEGA